MEDQVKGARTFAPQLQIATPTEPMRPEFPMSPFAPTNPFVAAAAEPYSGRPGYGVNAAGASDFDPKGPFTYSMMKRGPAVHADEVEGHAAAVEVLVKWDQNTLHVSHESPPRSFFVGEEAGCHYFVPSQVLGTTRAPVVMARGMSVAVVLLPRSRGTVSIPGQETVTFEDLVQSGRAHPSSEVSGAYEFELPTNARALMHLEGSGLVFEVGAVRAGKAPPVGAFSSFEPVALLFIGLSFLLHVGIVSSMAFFMPSMGGDDSEAIGRDQLLLMQKLLNSAAERELEKPQTDEAANSTEANEGGTGERAKNEEGSMGNPTSHAANMRYGVQGPKDNPDPHLAREAALREARDFGLVGLLNVGAGGDPNAPTSPWGRDEALGNDAMSARGNMWGDAIGEAFGGGSLGLTGVGEGAGGHGEGVGLGTIGILGHGAGTGTGSAFGSGSGSGRVNGAHKVKATTWVGETKVNGRLPAEVIQRIVRQNFGRFRLCYENALRTSPTLQGRVAVKFVIDRTGAVSTAADGGSDLPDHGVVGCVVRGFGNLSFPQPEGGIVTVVYPITFSPGT